jgi:hypothetical protein
LEIAQLIKKQDKILKVDFSSFLVENINLLFYIFIGYLLISIFNFSFLKIHHSKISYLNKLKLAFFNFYQFDLNQMSLFNSKFILIFLFFRIFLFFNLNILTNTIKTDKVVIDTKLIIDSINKLSQTSLILGFLDDEEFIFKNAPKNSFLKKLYQTKIKGKKFWKFKVRASDEDNNKFLKRKLYSYFFFTRKRTLLHFLF